MSGPPTASSAGRSSVAAIRAALADQLHDAVEGDTDIAAALRVWSGHVDTGNPENAVERAAARQASVLAARARYRDIVGEDPPTALRATPVTPFAGLTTPPAAEAVASDLADATAADPRAGAEAIGADYADALDDAERRVRGQFYTPRPVAEVVVEWVLDVVEESVGDDEAGTSDGDGLPRVLDPAAGTGTFPLTAYDALRERFPDADPSTLHSRLVAVDVDGTALHLAALRLSARSGGGSVDAFERHDRSFFDFEPGRDLAHVDAVVGNPPFVRAGALTPDRNHFRAHLDALGPAGETPYADGGRAISGRSDASVYFVTHATRFLRPGGRLGLVLPAKWLESQYGLPFRRFLDDHYRVETVVGFGARTFDALVDTVLLLAERRERPVDAGDEPVRFVRLDREFEAAAVRRLVEAEMRSADCDRDDGARTVRRSQATFATARQCSPYLRAPTELIDLLDHPDLVPLGDLASVSRGVTTGANGFFLLDDDERDRWGIDDRFLRPAVRSIRGVQSRTIDEGDVERWILDVHGFLAERLDDDGGERPGDDDTTDTSPAERAKDALRNAGHDGLLGYVEEAEAEGVHERRTCRSRRVWFDLGELATPDAFVPKLLRERVFTVRNRAGAIPTNAIDCLSVREGIDPEVLLGVLDSSLCRAAMEVWGRDEAGMLQLMTAETRTLPVPDVRTMSSSKREAIRAAASDLDADGSGQEPLDSAVVDALDVDASVERIGRLRQRLLRRRVDGGDQVDVPLER